MTKDNSDPAFPCTALYQGMTLRQWYAGQMLMGMAGGSIECMLAHAQRAAELDLTDEEYAAQLAFSMADAMLEEGDK